MATFTNPANGATNGDTTAPFTWTVGGTGVQGYRLTLGTTVGGNDVVDSGPLPATQTA